MTINKIFYFVKFYLQIESSRVILPPSYNAGRPYHGEWAEHFVRSALEAADRPEDEKKDLQALTKLSSAVIAKLGRDETVHLDTLLKICAALRCDLADIIEINMEEPAIE